MIIFFGKIAWFALTAFEYVLMIHRLYAREINRIIGEKILSYVMSLRIEIHIFLIEKITRRMKNVMIM